MSENKTKVQYGIEYSSNEDHWVQPRKLFDTLKEAIDHFNQRHCCDCRKGFIEYPSNWKHKRAEARVIRVATSTEPWGLFLESVESKDVSETYAVYFNGEYHGTVEADVPVDEPRLQRLALQIVHNK